MKYSLVSMSLINVFDILLFVYILPFLPKIINNNSRLTRRYTERERETGRWQNLNPDDEKLKPKWHSSNFQILAFFFASNCKRINTQL